MFAALVHAWDGSRTKLTALAVCHVGPNYDRLVELKRRYDPGNVFRHNHNIRP